jgi:hypothetical protein
MAGVCLLLALTAVWLYYTRAQAVTNNALASLEPKVNELSGYESRINGIRSGMASQQEAAAPLLHSIEEREYWAKIINDINSRLPENYIWITSFQPEVTLPAAPAARGSARSTTPAKAPAAAKAAQKDPSTVVNIRGLYLDNEAGAAVVDQFIKRLNESPYFSVEEDPATRVRETPNTESWAYAYAFRLNLKNPISIPSKTK